MRTLKLALVPILLALALAAAASTRRGRFDVLIHATESGVWAFHCHLLNHAESDHGMHGMVTALIVK
jgi:FtsP/CotA-like multicopper oxidase with cupredoxin domain